MDWAADKNLLRKTVKAELISISKARLQELSRRMIRLLSKQNLWLNSKNILAYAPLPIEPDLNSLLQQALLEKKQVATLKSSACEIGYEPRFVSKWPEDLVSGAFGVLEPSDDCPPAQWNRLDLALIPGVAFDTFGRRLGKGKGYYDRALANYSGIKIGVAFDEQIVEPGLIPIEAHDILMDWILTPSMIIEVGSQTLLK